MGVKYVGYETTIALSEAWIKGEDTLSDLHVNLAVTYVACSLLILTLCIPLCHYFYLLCVTKSKCKDVSAVRDSFSILFRVFIFCLGVWNVFINIVYCIVFWITFQYVEYGMQDFGKISDFEIFFGVITTILTTTSIILLNSMEVYSFRGCVQNCGIYIRDMSDDKAYYMNLYSADYFNCDKDSKNLIWYKIIFLNMLCHDLTSILYLLSSKLFALKLFDSGLNNRELYLSQRNSRRSIYARCILLGFLQVFYIFYCPNNFNSFSKSLLTVPIIALLSNGVCFFVHWLFSCYRARKYKLSKKSGLVDCIAEMRVTDNTSDALLSNNEKVFKLIDHGSLFVNTLCDKFALKWKKNGVTLHSNI